MTSKQKCTSILNRSFRRKIINTHFVIFYSIVPTLNTIYILVLKLKFTLFFLKTKQMIEIIFARDTHSRNNLFLVSEK